MKYALVTKMKENKQFKSNKLLFRLKLNKNEQKQIDACKLPETKTLKNRVITAQKRENELSSSIMEKRRDPDLNWETLSGTRCLAYFSSLAQYQVVPSRQ